MAEPERELRHQILCRLRVHLLTDSPSPHLQAPHSPSVARTTEDLKTTRETGPRVPRGQGCVHPPHPAILTSGRPPAPRPATVSPQNRGRGSGGVSGLATIELGAGRRGRAGTHAAFCPGRHRNGEENGNQRIMTPSKPGARPVCKGTELTSAWAEPAKGQSGFTDGRTPWSFEPLPVITWTVATIVFFCKGMT